VQLRYDGVGVERRPGIRQAPARADNAAQLLVACHVGDLFKAKTRMTRMTLEGTLAGAMDKRGNSPLHVLASNTLLTGDDNRRRMQMLSLLLAARPDWLNWRNVDGWYALCRRASRLFPRHLPCVHVC
jgi:hypothetical protein